MSEYSKNGVGGTTVEHLAQILSDIRENLDISLDHLILGDGSNSMNSLINGVKKSLEESSTFSSNDTTDFNILFQ